MTYPDYIGREAVRRLNESWGQAGGGSCYRWPRDSDHPAVTALCQLLTETGFKEPEPRDLVMARRIMVATTGAIHGGELEWRYLSGGHDKDDPSVEAVRALLREYAGGEA